MSQVAAEMTPPPTPPIHYESVSFASAKRRRILTADRTVFGLAIGSAMTILVMVSLLVVVLIYGAWPSIKEYGLPFLWTHDWRPNELEQPKTGPDGKIVMEDGEIVMETLKPAFGALPVIYGTAVSSVLALLFAIPTSLGAAIFLIRIAPRYLAGPVSFLIEFLAAIPSIAYGLWGLFILSPFLQEHVEPFLRDTLGKLPGFSWMFYERVVIGGQETFREIPLTGRDMFAGGLILGIMIVPIITAISRDVLANVPRAQLEGTTALGATWWQSSLEMLKFSRSGLFGGIMLGFARAAGETMAITMVIGNNHQIKTSPFAPAQTMSSLLANEFTEANGVLHPAALIEVALILLVMSLIFNVAARYLVVGKGSRTSAAH